MNKDDNFSRKEEKKFSDYGESWWEDNSVAAPLHKINPLRINFIRENTDSLKNCSVLDVGCGGGILTEELAKYSHKVLGIDICSTAIDAAKNHAAKQQSSANYKQTTIETFHSENPDAKYDIITCMEMLEHVPNPEQIISHVSRILNPGGTAFFSTLNRNMKSFLFGIIGAEYILNMIPKGTHSYSSFIKPSELNSWCKKHGLEFTGITGISYNPLTDKFSLSKDTSVNYLCCFKKST
ncbi:MAG: bifunctional 2-polyprenyl-6-hydroxyphenol methylase/3-demethylubiquinol 3-O-methyltransferase UbiG [Legionellales bacterium]|jgi:2-polyprenyl-6-hydroxyphenyl methylase / 3-demethylubiquinone-9 3-methyltransferase|nr:bifunctional 2-polyprenyl-6-hydroxyphenol methylase/3-demethylubiquinol 3-O-methyltransferase UbiG [Legionellales bacterium]